MFTFDKKLIDFYRSEKSYDKKSLRLSILISTVLSVIKRFKQFESTETLHGRRRQPKLSPRTACKICLEVETHSRVALSDTDRMLDSQGTSVSTRTLLSCICRSEVHGRRLQHTYFIKNVTLMI